MPTKIFPTYLFLGEEGFLKEEAIKKLAAQYLDKNTKDLNYAVFYSQEKDFNVKDLLDCLNTSPFLSKKRLIVLKDAETLDASEKEAILSYLRSPLESSIFVIESSTSIINNPFLLEASKLANLVYCRPLRDADINLWLTKSAATFGKKFSPDAISAIKESIPHDLRIMSSYIDNIALYVGNKAIITKEDVLKVVGISPRHTAFDLIGAIERKDAKKALRIFSALKKDKKKETELLGLLGWNTRMLLRIRELLKIKTKIEIKTLLGLNAGSYLNMIDCASRFKKASIVKLLDEVLVSDADIKSGEDPTQVLEKLLVKMCS